MSVSFDLDHLSVVLVSARNPLNIGAAARAMCNFGFSHLRVVNPHEPAFRDARSAVGAAGVMADAEEFQNVAEAVSDCTLVLGTVAVGRRSLQHPSHALAAGAFLIRDELIAPSTKNRRVAILFGSEKFGLTNDDLSHCHAILHIPTSDLQPSMNLGQAVAVCLYELVRDNPQATGEAASPGNISLPASAGDMERVTTTMTEALHASGYMGTSPGEDKELSIRRLVRRLQLSAQDATLLLGMLRQIIWKLRPKP